MWLMLQQDEPDDYVLATGATTLVRDFVTRAFQQTGVTLDWTGEGLEEKGVCSDSGRVLVEVDPRYFRPTEVELLIGDPGKARDRLGWTHETDWEQLCDEMVAADLIAVPTEQLRHGA
jgi:GDPmannose 4,6-dehydratase